MYVEKPVSLFAQAYRMLTCFISEVNWYMMKKAIMILAAAVLYTDKSQPMNIYTLASYREL